MADICGNCGCDKSLTNDNICPICNEGIVVDVVFDEDDWKDLKSILSRVTWGTDQMNRWNAMVKRVDTRINTKRADLIQRRDGK